MDDQISFYDYKNRSNKRAYCFTIERRKNDITIGSHSKPDQSQNQAREEVFVRASQFLSITYTCQSQWGQLRPVNWAHSINSTIWQEKVQPRNCLRLSPPYNNRGGTTTELVRHFSTLHREGNAGISRAHSRFLHLGWDFAPSANRTLFWSLQLSGRLFGHYLFHRQRQCRPARSPNPEFHSVPAGTLGLLPRSCR